MAEFIKLSHICYAHQKSDPPEKFRQEVYGASSSFLNLVLNNQCYCQQFLQNSTLMPTTVNLHYSLGTFNCTQNKQDKI